MVQTTCRALLLCLLAASAAAEPEWQKCVSCKKAFPGTWDACGAFHRKPKKENLPLPEYDVCQVIVKNYDKFNEDDLKKIKTFSVDFDMDFDTQVADGTKAVVQVQPVLIIPMLWTAAGTAVYHASTCPWKYGEGVVWSWKKCKKALDTIGHFRDFVHEANMERDPYTIVSAAEVLIKEQYKDVAEVWEARDRQFREKFIKTITFNDQSIEAGVRKYLNGHLQSLMHDGGGSAKWSCNRCSFAGPVLNQMSGGDLKAAQQQAKRCEGSSNGNNGVASAVCCEGEEGLCCATAAVGEGAVAKSGGCKTKKDMSDSHMSLIREDFESKYTYEYRKETDTGTDGDSIAHIAGYALVLAASTTGLLVLGRARWRREPAVEERQERSEMDVLIDA